MKRSRHQRSDHENITSIIFQTFMKNYHIDTNGLSGGALPESKGRSANGLRSSWITSIDLKFAPVTLEDGPTDTLDLQQFVHRGEGAIFLAIGDYRLGLGLTDAKQLTL